MNCFYHDGTLVGFLCTLGHAIKNNQQAVRLVHTNDEGRTGDLFGEEIHIPSDLGWAEKVTVGLAQRLGRSYLRTLGLAFFSERDGIEEDLIELTRKALKSHADPLRHLTDPLVQRVNAAALRTARERHRLYGLARFMRLTDDCYLALITPKTNVAPLLGEHFARRYADQRWVILDTGRNLAIGGDGSQWGLIDGLENVPEMICHSEEQHIADLWRSFYRNVSIPDRYNPKLRRQLMPEQYWQYLTELQPDRLGG